MESWGRYPKVEHSAHAATRRDSVDLSTSSTNKLLAYGQGRSYGDSCLNDGGELVTTGALDRYVAFDKETGVLRCESGVTFEAIINSFMPRGWFLPVTPGTKYVSVGGALANDIHGKNHHTAGTFGRHVRAFELLRSDGSRLVCTPEENPEYFAATIGGLGLTGFITWVEFQLIPVSSTMIDEESIKFSNLDEFFEISANSGKDFEYTVAWLDCIAAGEQFGRGIFMRGNHAKNPQDLARYKAPCSPLVVPFDFPSWALNPMSVRAFNTLYYNKQFSKVVKGLKHFNPFFYPLDSVRNWNRIYGKPGFLQFQCVVPSSSDNAAIRWILERIVKAKAASFLAVLKEFGDLESPGMLSFPRKGVTLCLDFSFQGDKTLKLFSELDHYVCEVGGALYPAKDACMSADSFKTFYPKWEVFKDYVDPNFSSSFWRRVNR